MLKRQKIKALPVGSVLIEAMISVALLLIGVIALIGLQARLVSSGSDAEMRSDAIWLVGELMAAIQANAGTVAKFDDAVTVGIPPEKTAWEEKVADVLSNGTSQVSVDANNRVVVEVTWRAPREDVADTHSYRVETTVVY